MSDTTTEPPFAPATGSALLAERCYALDAVEDELFERVNAILGCKSDECLKEGFVWGALDTWWDSYDGSVEVVRTSDAQWMSPEQASSIIALGFTCVFESCGTKGRQWLKNGAYGECSPREPKEVNRLRQKIAAMKQNTKASDATHEH